MMDRIVVTVAAVVLILPSSAGAKGPVAERSDAPDPPGITMGGTGLARVTAPQRLSDDSIRRAVAAARPTAISRAVNESRNRAKAVAEAMGLTLGELVAVDDRESQAERFGPFGSDPFCRRSRRSRRQRCEVPKFAVAAVTATFSTRETDATGLPERTITATGEGQAEVSPARRTSRSIRRALLDAGVDALAPALNAARSDAEALARSGHLQLGPVISIAQQTSSPFGEPLFEAGAFGPFGPGGFCGTITRPVVRRDPQTGRRRVVRRVRQRRCFFPNEITSSMRVTFGGG